MIQIKINGIEFLPIDNELTQDRLFRSGGIHLSNTVPTEKIKRYREERPNQLIEHNYFGTYYYRINTNKYPLNDLNFRKALSLSIDRDLIVKSILKGNQKVSYSFTPPDENSYNPNTKLEFNPAKAKLLLKESGYDTNSSPLEVLYNTSEGPPKNCSGNSRNVEKIFRIECGPNQCRLESIFSKRNSRRV